MKRKKKNISRRIFLKNGIKATTAISLGAVIGGTACNSTFTETVWQLDPEKCVQCGQCASHCVMTPSAVKCVHAYAICGYCKLCGGFFRPNVKNLNTGAENQLCPTGAIQRAFVENPYYEYHIDESLCVGCGKCVAGCGAFGNGSLHLQVRHDLCKNCNQCSIARVCPADAFVQVKSNKPYLFKELKEHEDGNSKL